MALLGVVGGLGDERAEVRAVHGRPLRLQGGRGAVGERGPALRGRGAQGPGERRARLRLRGQGPGDGGGGEAGVGEREAQGVDVADEPGVDQGDPLPGRGGRDQRGGLVGPGRDAYVETERPQIALQRRPGYRRTGEDGGRQTNSLLGADAAGSARPGPDPGRRRVGRGYRMAGSGNSSGVHTAEVRAPIMVDDHPALQTWPGPGPDSPRPVRVPRPGAAPRGAPAPARPPRGGRWGRSGSAPL
ncbi:hypothetical protein GCM10023329_04080 [Streptomyces sanyensis]|uniref:Uncharacterized protein n=1 Tax=Streptomyces sanyensis TaxID=568869 RepID=A0ABP8ZPF8_9ACTN